MQIGQGVRQGDVILRATKSVPRGHKVQPTNGRTVVEYGEITGHAHAVVGAGATVFVVEQAGRVVQQYLTVVGEPAQLVHEEHGTVTLPPGHYERWWQVEFSDEEERRVTD